MGLDWINSAQDYTVKLPSQGILQSCHACSIEFSGAVKV